MRANEINNRWGQSTSDYNIIKGVIEKYSPKTLLDFGCGSGRLFPVFNEFSSLEVWAYDQSLKAIEIAKSRFPKGEISYINSIQGLKVEKGFFDLIISNRVLSAVPPHEIQYIIEQLCFSSKYVYLNEVGPSDFVKKSSTWFMHDYKDIFALFDFELQVVGKIEAQKYFVFRKK